MLTRGAPLTSRRELTPHEARAQSWRSVRCEVGFALDGRAGQRRQASGPLLHGLKMFNMLSSGLVACAHTDGEGGSAWATFARRICLSVSGCTLWTGTRLAATCLAMRRRVSGVNASRDRDLFIARIRARLEEVVLVCLWSLTGPL